MDQHSAAYVAYSVALVLGMVLSFTFAAPVEIMLMPLLGNAATYVATVGLLVTPMLLALLKRRFL